MNTIKSAALLLVALLGAGAWAQKPAPSAEEYASLPVCTLSADGKRLAVEPCRTAPVKTPMPRRAVRQIIQPTPRMTVAPQAAMPATPPSPPLETLLHPPGAPIPTTGCDASGCYGADGKRYNNAGAAAVITPAGKVCTRNGALIQC